MGEKVQMSVKIRNVSIIRSISKISVRCLNSAKNLRENIQRVSGIFTEEDI